MGWEEPAPEHPHRNGSEPRVGVLRALGEKFEVFLNLASGSDQDFADSI